MSTRSMVHFVYSDSPTKIVANIYRHSDGYPEGMVPDLRRFFADVKAQTKDTRFDDPEYLAAKFIVWQAGQYTAKNGWQEQKNPLDFLGLGVAREDHGDIEYVYTIFCGQSGDPIITCKTPDGHNVDILEWLADEIPSEQVVTKPDNLIEIPKPVKNKRETKYWKGITSNGSPFIYRNRAGHYTNRMATEPHWYDGGYDSADLKASTLCTKEEAEKILGIKL